MNELMNLTFQGANIRVLMRDGEPWWVARDVCEALGIANYRDAVARLDEDEKDAVGITDAMGRTQETTIINEPGLYRIVLGARMKHDGSPESERRNAKVAAFKRWVTHEVLPSIRRTGSYSLHGRYGPTTMIGGYPVPTTYVGALRLAADLAEENERQRAVIQELTPKAEFHDRVASSQDAISIRDAAKVLGTGQNRLFAWLRGQNILMADNRPYQRYLDAGYFRVIEQTWTDSAGKVHISHKTLVTGLGMTWLQKRWDADHPPSDPPRRRRQLSVVQ